MQGKEEIFEIVAPDGKITGMAKRSEVHGNPALLHRTVHCLVFDSMGNLYLQKRSMAKDVQPGKWDTSVGGHVMPGESVSDAVRRETFEELGIRDAEFKFLYRYIMRNDFESELVDTFKMIYDGSIVPDPAEISEGRFWKREEIDSAEDRSLFTPNFIDEWNKYKETEKK